MMNSNWTVKTAQFKPTNNDKVTFDQNALNAHRKASEENNSAIASMLGSLGSNDIDGYDENLGDFNNRLGQQEEVPELGSDQAVQGAAEEMLGTTPEQNDALDSDTKADFTVTMANFKPTENKKVEFDQNALENHRQNGLKGTIKSMLGGLLQNGIGAAMA